MCFISVFLMNSSFLWILIVSVILGFFRCFIQTPLALVIAEEYPERFPTAFSLYMVVLGIVNLVFGILIGMFVQKLSYNLITYIFLFFSICEVCYSKWRGSRPLTDWSLFALRNTMVSRIICRTDMSQKDKRAARVLRICCYKTDICVYVVVLYLDQIVDLHI